jgi:glycosyltransferase involved in cell wall biosynthesis
VRVALVFGGIPGFGHGGSTMAAWTIVEELLAHEHEVLAVLLPEAGLLDDSVQGRIAALEELGATVHTVAVPDAQLHKKRWRRRLDYARSIALPKTEELFPARRAAPDVRAALADARIDAGIAFGLEAIAASVSAGPPFLAALSHPPGISRRLRLRYDPAQRGFLSRLGERSFLAYADRHVARLLRRFPSVAVFSPHHADWARRSGAMAWYAHYPLPDLAGPHWRERRGAANRGSHRPRILMIGHLRGIGTISGLHLFIPAILPRLEQALGRGGFEVHVVGGHDPPQAFVTGLQHPSVRLRGQISDPAEEFFAADVLLAPNPTTTGASARVLSGLSFGNCVVAHTDTLVGIPELVHDENCLLGSDGPTLADATLRALADADLRARLGESARALYERAFSPEVSARRLVHEIERLGTQAHSSDQKP